MNTKIDEIDKKLLFELWQDCRQPSTVLATRLKTSREVVDYRIKKLEHAGIIYGYNLLIAADMFGYATYHLHIRLRDIRENREKQIISYLASRELVKWVSLCSGRWDIIVTVLARNAAELDSFICDIAGFMGDNLRDIEVMQHARTIKQASLPIFPKKPFRQPLISIGKKSGSAKISLDKLDTNILNYLAENSRASLVAMSTSLHQSPQTISYRMKSLKQSGVIRGFRSKVTIAQLGYSWYLLLFDLGKFTEKEETMLASLFSSMPDVLLAEKVLGRWNLRVEISASNHEYFRKALVHIRNAISAHISSYELVIIFKDYKQVSLPKGMVF